MRRIVITALTAAAALAAASVATAAPSPSYQVTGIETGLPQGEVSPFAGIATGSAGDRGFWQASVAHVPLVGCSSCAITGGTFSLTSNNGSRISGTFTGGAISLTSGAAACGQQQYAVNGSLSTSSGAMDFAGTLTHYRLMFRGTCRTLFATVQGTLGPSAGGGF
jgi:hypothetical protein